MFSEYVQNQNKENPFDKMKKWFEALFSELIFFWISYIKFKDNFEGYDLWD